MGMFGHKKICKVTNLKVHSKGRIYFIYFFIPVPLFSTTNIWICFPEVVFLFFLYDKNRSRQGNLGLAGEENAWLSTACFKIEPLCGCFYITVFLMETDSFQKIGCHFHFILHVMSYKALFVSRALLCLQRYQGNLDLYSNSTSRWQIIR